MTHPSPEPRRRGRGPLLGAMVAVAALALAGCTDASDGRAPTPGPTGTAAGADKVVLITHDSFAASEDVIAAFTAETGLELEIRSVGDAGSMVNQLVLTKDEPLGDAVFGVDNTFASRALDAGVLDPYLSPAATGRIGDLAVDEEGGLTAVDYSDVCVNVDHEWFTENGVAEPVTLEDLLKPEYKDLLVVEDPASSSPGLAFLLATIGRFGEGWADYWTGLKGNGVKVASGWTEAYYTDFSGPSSEGDRPLVVSYASSPPYELQEGAEAPATGALLDTCFRQVEYAGVLAGAVNPDGARQLIDFLLSDTFQDDIPGQMYVYPASETATLPEEWQKWAPLAPAPFEVDPADIAANREAWIEQWTDVVIG